MSQMIRDCRLMHGEIPVLLLKTRLPASCKLLWAVLDSFGENIFPRIGTISDRSSLSASTIKRSIRKLEETGWIKHAQTGRASVYKLTMPTWAWQKGQNELSAAIGQNDPSERRKKKPQKGHIDPSLHINNLSEALNTSAAEIPQPQASGSPAHAYAPDASMSPLFHNSSSKEIAPGGGSIKAGPLMQRVLAQVARDQAAKKAEAGESVKITWPGKKAERGHNPDDDI